MTRILTHAAFTPSRRPARPILRLAPAGLPLLAALLSSGITLVSFSAVDTCATTTASAPTAVYATSSVA